MNGAPPETAFARTHLRQIALATRSFREAARAPSLASSGPVLGLLYLFSQRSGHPSTRGHLYLETASQQSSFVQPAPSATPITRSSAISPSCPACAVDRETLLPQLAWAGPTRIRVQRRQLGRLRTDIAMPAEKPSSINLGDINTTARSTKQRYPINGLLTAATMMLIRPARHSKKAGSTVGMLTPQCCSNTPSHTHQCKTVSRVSPSYNLTNQSR